MKKEPKFIRLIPGGSLPEHIHNIIAMVVHMTNTKSSMDIFEVQAELFAYYKDYNNPDMDGHIDVSTLSIPYITACLYLACEYGCAKLVEE